jgi:hypothetical protein
VGFSSKIVKAKNQTIYDCFNVVQSITRIRVADASKPSGHSSITR